MPTEHPRLSDRVALVTGVSRPSSIGAGIAERLHRSGATVVATGWPAHDDEMPWGSDDFDPDFELRHRDLEDPTAPAKIVDEVVDDHGRIDIVIATHARSSSQTLDELTIDELGRSWAANVASVLLLAQQFARRHEPVAAPETPTGRMIWFTSGQHLGPMPDELAYAVTKAALHGMTTSLDRALGSTRIIGNCINPGPVDTGWADPDVHARVAGMFPDGRWGTPTDIADVVHFLVSDEGAWIRGQVLDCEGGFHRFPI
ncbi:MAG: 3-ketoacyl-ACP reductase [Acidimicrobiales bacterium]|nr:MAG: 3-ketoacyl-ACP reductase [Acidimicrobiales bacterium]